MKTLPLFIVVACLGIIYPPAGAQDYSHAAGVRAAFGQNSYNYAGAEFSYQKDVKRIGRRETDIGWYTSNQWDVLKLTILRQWKFLRFGKFNVYGGGGAAGGYVMYPFDPNEGFGTVNLNIGMDFTFRFPIQIALDWRPEWFVLNNYGERVGYEGGLAIRYKFSP